jgi:hypothetical protein
MDAPRLTDLFGLSLPGALNVLRGVREWRAHRGGMLTTNFAEAGGFIRSAPDEAIPDLQLHFVVGKTEPPPAFDLFLVQAQPDGTRQYNYSYTTTEPPVDWLGAEIRYNSRIDSLKKLLGTGGFDAVFVGSGAPKGKELELPGRKEGDANIHIGIQWLESVAFKHLDKIGERVLIIGVGNTAMDCCRSSLRLGAKDVKVMARKPRQFFKASEWELEDAEEGGAHRRMLERLQAAIAKAEGRP